VVAKCFHRNKSSDSSEKHKILAHENPNLHAALGAFDAHGTIIANVVLLIAQANESTTTFWTGYRSIWTQILQILSFMKKNQGQDIECNLNNGTCSCLYKSQYFTLALQPREQGSKRSGQALCLYICVIDVSRNQLIQITALMPYLCFGSSCAITDCLQSEHRTGLLIQSLFVWEERRLGTTSFPQLRLQATRAGQASVMWPSSSQNMTLVVQPLCEQDTTRFEHSSFWWVVSNLCLTLLEHRKGHVQRRSGQWFDLWSSNSTCLTVAEQSTHFTGRL